MNCNAILENEKLVLSNSVFSYTVEGVKSIAVDYPQERGCSDEFMQVTAQLEEKEVKYQMWEELPVVRILNLGDLCPWKFDTDHHIIKSTKLNTFSDNRDTVWEQREVHMFRMGCIFPLDGDIYFFENPEDFKAVVIISETPDLVKTQLTIPFDTGEVHIENEGEPVVVGVCEMGQCEKLTRAYFRRANRRPNIITMSNTWGDCNGRDRVCAEFVKKEVDAAAEIGVDIVQIDDGWQMGMTAYELEREPDRRLIWHTPDWELNKERFPNGIEEVSAYAKEKGIKIGMWFLPYSIDHPTQFEFDKALLKTAYDVWGVRFFKLDLYRITCHEDKQRMLELLRYIYTFGDDVSVQMDVTRHRRLDALGGREYGTIFVENRYTQYGNLFPHRTLRNLWMMSRFMPANRFQFELPNPDLNKDKYRENDPFVPCNYSMDYLFAAVMLCNPLFWMEMQFLSEARRAELKPVMDVWQQHRQNLCDADVCPIGEKPSGRSITGFSVEADDKTEYLLLFREVTDREGAVISCPGLKAGEVEILASNCQAQVKAMDGTVEVKFSQSRGYVFCKVK